jgi:hypothetical protein
MSQQLDQVPGVVWDPKLLTFEEHYEVGSEIGRYDPLWADSV